MLTTELNARPSRVMPSRRHLALIWRMSSERKPCPDYRRGEPCQLCWRQVNV